MEVSTPIDLTYGDFQQERIKIFILKIFTGIIHDFELTATIWIKPQRFLKPVRFKP
jgi:hypothetical protein